MNETGHTLEEIADTGDWALRADLDAGHIYFTTTERQQLSLKQALRKHLREHAV